MAEKDKPKSSETEKQQGAESEAELSRTVNGISGDYAEVPGPNEFRTQPVDIVDSVRIPVDISNPTAPVPVTLLGTVPVNVTMSRPEPPNIDKDPSLILNVAIRNRSEAISFNRYQEFINRVLCGSPTEDTGDEGTVVSGLRQGVPPIGMLSNVYAYELLKSATDAFLLMECGMVPRAATSPQTVAGIVIEGRRDARTGQPLEGRTDLAGFPIPDDIPGVSGASLGRSLTTAEIKAVLSGFLGSRGLPYLDLIANTLFQQSQEVTSPYCYGILQGNLEPSFLELIWSYWHEEGMLVQSINAIALRFQNKRISGGRDPLAHLELDPLRPLNNILWGYIQDEINRLTIARRAYEYQHEYGLALYGRAVPRMRPADRRSMFIEAFHNLLHLASGFFKEQSDTQVIPDGFPLLNAIKEVHLILAEGAHNQFGDLPWTARVEMLVQKWLLSRQEIREFLGGRIMVPYSEPWMGIVDSMKTLQGWTDVSVRYFRDLGVFGEQLLLAIRYGNWSDINDELSAKNWANYWRFAIQGYIHAYRAVTGVDLAAFTNSVRLPAESYLQPSLLLRNRLNAQQRPQLSE
jgi:hypothetical protein